MALVDVEGIFYATVLVGGTRQATAATKWASIPACSGIKPASSSSVLPALPVPRSFCRAWSFTFGAPVALK